MAALARVGHSLKGRVHGITVIACNGHARILPGCQSSNISLKHLHLSQAKYNHLSSQSVILSRLIQKNESTNRNLHASASDNLDKESKLPLIHPTKGNLVYTGNMTNYVKALKTFSLSTSLLSLLAQPMVLAAAKDDLMFKAGVMGSLSAIVFSTPLLVHMVTKKYVTDLYFNQETKVFTLAYKSFFLRRKEMEFKTEDVVIPFTPRMFVSHIIKGRSCFIDFQAFKDMEAYKIMVGYDKPFEIPKGSQSEKAVKKKKKFGLFEDEKDKVTNVDDNKLPPDLIAQQVIYDDDDDHYVKQPVKQKQTSKMR